MELIISHFRRSFILMILMSLSGYQAWGQGLFTDSSHCNIISQLLLVGPQSPYVYIRENVKVDSIDKDTVYYSVMREGGYPFGSDTVDYSLTEKGQKVYYAGPANSDRLNEEEVEDLVIVDLSMNEGDSLDVFVNGDVHIHTLILDSIRTLDYEGVNRETYYYRVDHTDTGIVIIPTAGFEYIRGLGTNLGVVPISDAQMFGVFNAISYCRDSILAKLEIFYPSVGLYGECDPDSLDLKIRTLGTEDVSVGQIKVYPNPGNGAFHVELPNVPGNWEIQVSDAMGRVIRRYEDVGVETKIDLRHEVDGIYFLELTHAEMGIREYMKVLKE